MSERRFGGDLMGKPSETMELSGSIDLRGRRVLVADAQSEARWAVVGALRDAGARVAEARDGLDALEVARTQPPELIVASVSMPRVNWRNSPGSKWARRRRCAMPSERALNAAPVISFW